MTDAGSAIAAEEAVAESAERRWALVVGAIVVLLLGMMVYTGLHWAAMPPSRVEVVNPVSLHRSGEFIESNLGTRVEEDGRVVVRLVAQQYSFTPQCILVPLDAPVTFRATSSDVVHGFIITGSNANVMLIPGFVASFTTRFTRVGESTMPCHEYCGTGHEGMWARVQVIDAGTFAQQAQAGRSLSCVPG